MDKSGNSLGGIVPLSKINPVMPVAGIGSPVQSLEARASDLAKQQAALMTKVPLPTSEAINNTQKAVSTTSVSLTAQLISQILKQAEAAGISQKYVAQTAITQNPKHTVEVSQQLRQAISQSGLFYESHLAEFAEGHRSLHEIRQEPQNRLQHLMQSLLPQQLHILEHQRIAWHGEVWPQQKMDWNIDFPELHQDQDQTAMQEEQTPIVSDITLDLPKLGKVTAKISLQNGRMQIGLAAEQASALQAFKNKSHALINAIESNGQTLDGLTLKRLNQSDREVVHNA